MADYPDGVQVVQVAVTVENELVLPTPATERAAGDAGNYSGILQTYQTVATWTVATDKVGELKEILIISDKYTKTLAQITIAGVVWETDWSPTAAMPIIFEDLKLAAGAVVLVEAKSSDGTAIDVDALIVGKEIG
jgi:hypothetical protein